MTGLLVGLDIGGTKTALLARTPDGSTVVEVAVRRPDWDAEPPRSAAAWIRALLDEHLPAGSTVLGLGVGAQGLDTGALATRLERALATVGLPARCRNDAALLVPAAGLRAGLGMIAGTGAIVVGEDARGELVTAGGWGAVLGDDAGAAGIVREATRAALGRHDDGLPDDGLLHALLDAFGVATAERLARTVNDVPTTEHWGPRAPAVFRAAEAGSATARAVVERASEHLVRLVDQAVRRGAVGRDVVAAGSVLTRQPTLAAMVRERLAASHPELGLTVLGVPPVVGALALARDAAGL